MAFTRRLEVRQERLRAVHDAPEVDVHQPREVLVAHRLDGRRERNPGVVEDEVDLAVFGGDGVGPREHRVAIGDVEALRGDLHRVALTRGNRPGATGLLAVG